MSHQSVNIPLKIIPYRHHVLNGQTNNWLTNHVYGINRFTDILQYRLRELYNLADVRCSERLCQHVVAFFRLYYNNKSTLTSLNNYPVSFTVIIHTPSCSRLTSFTHTHKHNIMVGPVWLFLGLLRPYCSLQNDYYYYHYRYSHNTLIII